jgi:hypothetical protein
MSGGRVFTSGFADPSATEWLPPQAEHLIAPGPDFGAWVLRARRKGNSLGSWGRETGFVPLRALLAASVTVAYPAGIWRNASTHEEIAQIEKRGPVAVAGGVGGSAAVMKVTEQRVSIRPGSRDRRR